MKTVLFLNNTIKSCGVQQWGIRAGRLLESAKNYSVAYAELSSEYEYFNLIRKYSPSIVVYNYHVDLMPWLKRNGLMHGVKHIAIVHEGFSHLNDHIGFDHYIYLPENTYIAPNWKDKVSIISRALLPYNGDYGKNSVTTIGSFGFGFKHKQFPLIVRKVNEQFDNANIRINMPFQFKADPHGYMAKEEAGLCRLEITKPGIRLDITNKFMEEDELLEFLAGNDINAFFYDSSKLDSSSGATDFALSVDRPIAISHSPMFSHIIDKIGTEICIEYHSFQDIINNGTGILEPLKNKWSSNALIKEFEDIFNDV
jgi:hypothetical protein